MEFSPFEFNALIATIIIAAFGVAYALSLRSYILRQDAGTEKMQSIAAQIREGANAYLTRQFKTIIVIVVVLFVALVLSGVGAGWDIGLWRGVAFIMGCLASGITGAMGMKLAVQGNVRCAHAARTSLAQALQVAFKSGGVTGMFTVTMGLLGATLILMFFKERATEILLGFGFGGCLLALFMRVGGGIFTKAADVGADLVGKVEAGIPEDDPRNAAVIADNVGDNVGDCAGMAADIFESYEVTLVASMILALAHMNGTPEGMRLATVWIMFPIIVRAIGVLTSIAGIALVKSKTDDEFPMKPITRGFVLSAVLSAIAFAVVAKVYADDWRLFWATFSGLVLAIGMYKLTEFYTSKEYAPVQAIARSSQTGPATTILTGYGEGLESSVYSLLLIVGCIFFSMLVFGKEASAVEVLYGVSLCGLGMLTTTGVIISMDTYGPISDNAQGISEMAGIEDNKANVEVLDSVGNTTKAATKGIAVASAVIAAVSMFGSYISKVHEGIAGGGGGEAINAAALSQYTMSINSPTVFIGLLIGGAMPFLFSSMTIRAVSRAAFYIINEVRRQFREIPGLLEGKEGVMPESGKIVDICTASALKELVGPGVLAIAAPCIVGCWFGWPGLGGYLAGIIVVGQLMAILMCNAGGAWDNGKKAIEDGAYGGKNSDAHKAAVVGDTVGDPFKDTAGPALNPLIKVMNLIALLIVPTIVHYSAGKQNSEPGVALGVIGVVLAIIVAIALILSKRESSDIKEVQQAVEAAGTGD